MATLNLNNVAAALFPDVVRRTMERCFGVFIRSGALRIDFTGSNLGAPYQLTFQATYTWTHLNRDRCWYRPMIAGVTGNVYVEMLRRLNYCQDVRDPRTCEAVYRNTPQELGQAIANTAVHEAAHLFGLMVGGVDQAGHTGDPGNCMFENRFHRDYVPFLQDSKRTRKYTIQRGDTLSGIADRIGFRPPLATWRVLYDFRGQDGRRNRDLLRSHNPDLIFPGEEIWIPDVAARLSFMRSVELQEKSFTPAQIATMQRFLASGRTILP